MSNNERDQKPLFEWQDYAQQHGFAESFGIFLNFITEFHNQKIKSGNNTVRLQCPKGHENFWLIACWPKESSSKEICIGVSIRALDDIYGGIVNSKWLSKDSLRKDRDTEYYSIKLNQTDLAGFIKEMRESFIL